MLPNFFQIISIVILLVPGFLSIQIYKKLIPSKSMSNLDSTILSVVFTLIIHGLYTTIFSYFFINNVNILLKEVTDKNISTPSIIFILLYLVGLFIISCILGLLAFIIQNKGRFYKLLKKMGVNLPFENLWDEVMYLYYINNTAPLVIIDFEDISYAGQVHRSSFDLDKNDRKEIILTKAKFITKTMHSWEECDTNFVYLDVSEVEKIYLSNGKEIFNK